MVRAWLSLIWSSVAVAMVAAAAQLEVAGALGIVRWSDSSADAWSVRLTWIAFIYLVAVVSGAAAGRRVLRRPGQPDGLLGRVLAAFLAGIGATLATGLVLLLAAPTAPGTGPAPGPVGSGSPYPELVVATTAGAGAVVGVALALIAGAVRVVAVGIRGTIGWVWLVGAGAATAGYLSHRAYPPPRLAVLDAPTLIPATAWTGPDLMIGVTAAVSVAVAAAARWGGAGRVGIGFSGLFGPAVVAAAYLIAWPGMGTAQPDQYDSYRAAIVAAGAGLLASALVALFPGRSKRKLARRRAVLVPVEPDPVDNDTTWALGPRPQAADPTIMGQPRNPYEEDYSQWLRDQGHPGEPQTVEIRDAR